MKGAIISLILLALELTICLISSGWICVNLSNTELCIKRHASDHETPPIDHQPVQHTAKVIGKPHRISHSRTPDFHTFRIGDVQIQKITEPFSSIAVNNTSHQFGARPVISSRENTIDNRNIKRTLSVQSKTEIALFVTGIILIIVAAVNLSIIEFSSKQSRIHHYRVWLHLTNVILLTISLILTIAGFCLLQFTLKSPLNGAIVLGFIVGILFIAVLAINAGITFLLVYSKRSNGGMKDFAM